MPVAKITVEGFVSKDPETRDAGQHRITTVTVPVEQGRMKDGQWMPDVDQNGQKIVHWWEAEFWNEHGDAVSQAITKSMLVTITGEPRPRAYLKKDGTAGLAETIVNATVAQVVRRPSRQQPQGGAGQSGWATTSPGGFGSATGDPGGFGNFGPEESQPF